MAAEAGAIITFIFNGEDSDDIPRNVTHLIIHENITVIPQGLFFEHSNLVEVYCHERVTKIEESAFCGCLSLRRVIIPGVTIVESNAFLGCGNLVYVECDKLERIGISSFSGCDPLSSIKLPSVKIVERSAFCHCSAITQAIFGNDLEAIEYAAFYDCKSLESITIPLKIGLLTNDSIFTGCTSLKRVDLVEGDILRDFADVLLLESWSVDVNGALDSIDQILSNADAGDGYYNIEGGKVIVIREWIEGVLRKVSHYNTAHRGILDKAATVLQLSLPNYAVMNIVLPFVELPTNTFDGEGEAR